MQVADQVCDQAACQVCNLDRVMEFGLTPKMFLTKLFS